jgi:hypothetical protein
MTYRPTEFQVNNSGGIECDISIDPETLAGQPMFFVIQQDSSRITVSLECLEDLLSCARRFMAERRAASLIGLRQRDGLVSGMGDVDQRVPMPAAGAEEEASVLVNFGLNGAKHDCEAAVPTGPHRNDPTPVTAPKESP